MPSTPPSTDRHAGETLRLSRRYWLYAVAGIVVLTLLTFAPLRHNAFVTFDDDIWMGKNAALNPPSFSGLLAKWTDPFDGKTPGVFQALYTPLSHTLWFLAALAGQRPVEDGLGITLDPVPFRVLSVLVHAAAAAGVYRLLRALAVSPGIGLVGSAAFLLHPMQIEAVAWASGLKDLLWTALMVWALAAWVNGLNRGACGGVIAGCGGAARGRVPWWPAVSLGAVALLAKPTAVVIPVMFAWLWWCLGCRPRGDAAAAGPKPWARLPPRAVGVALAVSLAAAVPVAVMTAAFQTAETVQPVAWWQRPLVALDALGHYVVTLLWPVGLTIDYGRSPTWTVAELRWLPYTLVTLATAGVLLVWRDRVAMAGAGLAVLAVAPVLGLKDFDYATFTVVSDHYGYAWMVGAVVVLARAVQAASTHPLTRPLGGPKAAGAAAALACGVLVVLATLSHRQTRVWRDSGTLYLHCLAVQPRSAIVNSNYASHLYMTAKQLPRELRPPLIEAMRVHAAKALEIWPDFPQAHYLSGMAAAILGEPRVALWHYVRAATYYARHADFQVKVADVYAELGRLDEAEKHYREALRLDPQEPAARRMLERIAEFRGRNAPADEAAPDPAGQP